MANWTRTEHGTPAHDKTVICLHIPKSFVEVFERGDFYPACEDVFGACYVNGDWYIDPYGDYPFIVKVTHWSYV
jgi:hypothetical protein